MVKILVKDHRGYEELEELYLIVDAKSSEKLYELARELGKRGYKTWLETRMIAEKEEED